jgi:hypothetical protein
VDIVSMEFTGDGQMRLGVQMPESGRFTTRGLPHLPRRLFRLFPQMSKHKCDNDYGYSFKRECQDTELPHLLEHLIIELQSQVSPGGVLKGQTVWDWRIDPRGRFHVYVDYVDEVLAIACAKLAERIIKAIDDREIDALDIEAELNRLRAISRLGRELASELPHSDQHSWACAAASVGAAPREAVAVAA